jgi:hypothetical protein
MAELVYALCTLTSLTCAVLLVRQYRASRVPLLFWSSVCFLLLTASNVLLLIDLIVLPQVNLMELRSGVSLMATVFLIYGLIRSEGGR